MDVVKDLFDRLERDGVAVTSVSDGHVFAFTLESLERLVEDAKAGDGRCIVFVRSAPKEVA